MPIEFSAVLITTGVFLGLSAVLLIAERYLANYGICPVSINEGSAMFELRGGSTLLNALYANNVFIPSACGGKGSCGYCKVTVVSGGGPILPTETGFMTRSEIRSGVRLACQLKIKQNLEIRIPEVLLNARQYQAEVSQTRNLTNDIKEVTFALLEPSEIHHRPGQYVQVLAQGPDGAVYRAYSISSPTSANDRVQLVVRVVPGGIASTYIHGLQVGDPVVFTGPFGEFRLSEDPDVPIICVGGGAGMAPIACIIRSIYERWPDRECYLFFGCRTKSDIFYLEEFESLAEKHPNLEVIYGLSNPLSSDEEWNGDTGFIHLSVDKRLKKDARRQAFLCGPPPMIEAVTEVLAEKGLGEENVFYDKF